jgi:MoaA/NifB/PqqE/SkfB family radical SAM enzyme
MEQVNLSADVKEITDFAVYGTEPTAFLAGYEGLRERKLVPRYFSAPLFVMWELTAKCPLQCVHCYNESPKKVPELTTEQALAVAKELAELKVFSVCLTGGEPYMRRDFLQIARYLAQQRVPIATISNGWLITDEIAKEYAKYFQHVQVSLDGGTAEVHDKIRGRAGSFDRAIRAIQAFKRHGIDEVSVACTFNQLNKHTLMDVVEACHRAGVDKLRVQPVVSVGSAGKHIEIALSDDDLQSLKAQASEYKKNHPLREELPMEWGEPLPHIGTGVSAGIVFHLRITAEGYYSLSPYVPFVMGNAKDRTLREVWEGGFREGWRIPLVRDNCITVATNHDVNDLNRRFDYQYYDLLSESA